jgi:hypothetical protein
MTRKLASYVNGMGEDCVEHILADFFDDGGLHYYAVFDQRRNAVRVLHRRPDMGMDESAYCAEPID